MIEDDCLPLDAAAKNDLKMQAKLELIRLFLKQWRSANIAITFITIGVMLAWREYAPFKIRVLWCAIATVNYAAQSFVCWKFESAPSLRDAAPRWMPWFLLSVGVSGFIWGSVPWMVSGTPTSTSALLFASIFNVMMMFCVVNAPATPSMLLSAFPAVALLTVSALAQHREFFFEAIICAILFFLIALYGLRVNRALESTIIERFIAKDLAEKLRKNQEKLVKMENERSVLLERERLMRDMHDGFGSALASALMVAERSDANPEELANLLRECMEDLRVVIDSLEPIDNDLVALLAALRFRMEQRIKSVGLRFDWDMRELPALSWMGPSEALNILRLMQEILNNAIKHAHANFIRVAVRNCSNQVEVLITDDGCGFDPCAQHSGRGLRTMQQRAKNLGGELRIESAPDIGTRILLSLPISRS